MDGAVTTAYWRKVGVRHVMVEESMLLPEVTVRDLKAIAVIGPVGRTS